MVIYLEGGKVPLPEGWTLEEAVRVLRSMNHVVLRVEAKGVEVPVPKEKAA